MVLLSMIDRQQLPVFFYNPECLFHHTSHLILSKRTCLYLSELQKEGFLLQGRLFSGLTAIQSITNFQIVVDIHGNILSAWFSSKLMFKGTQSDTIIKLILEHYPAHLRKIVREESLDMAGSMNLIIKKCFPRATRVTDRFHVQKLACEAVQHVRIKHRWETLDEESRAYKQAKKMALNTPPKCYPMVIPKSNCWHEAGTYFLSPKSGGHRHNGTGLRYCSNTIRTLKRPINYRISYTKYTTA